MKQKVIRSKAELLKKMGKTNLNTVTGNEFYLDNFHKTSVAKNIATDLIKSGKVEKCFNSSWFESSYKIKKY